MRTTTAPAIAGLLTFFVLTAFAHDHDKHAHGKHVHGHGELSVAFDGTKGTIELRAPADSIFGFEHEAKKDADKKRRADALAKLESRAGGIVAFDAAIGCEISKRAIGEKRDGKHLEIIATYDVACAKSPKGGRISFKPAAVFPALKDVDVTILIDELQKSAECGSEGVDVSL